MHDQKRADIYVTVDNEHTISHGLYKMKTRTANTMTRPKETKNLDEKLINK